MIRPGLSSVKLGDLKKLFLAVLLSIMIAL